MSVLEKGNIKNSVNFPNVELPHSGDTRICIMHRNVAGVLSKISTAMADAGINIENMINRSRGNYAYTIVETIGQVPEEALSKLYTLEDMIRIRVSDAAFAAGFRVKHIGEVLYAKLKNEFDAVVDKCQVRIYTDPEKVKEIRAMGNETFAKRDERLKTLTDESVDEALPRTGSRK